MPILRLRSRPVLREGPWGFSKSNAWGDWCCWTNFVLSLLLTVIFSHAICVIKIMTNLIQFDTSLWSRQNAKSDSFDNFDPTIVEVFIKKRWQTCPFLIQMTSSVTVALHWPIFWPIWYIFMKQANIFKVIFQTFLFGGSEHLVASFPK